MYDTPFPQAKFPQHNPYPRDTAPSRRAFAWSTIQVVPRHFAARMRRTEDSHKSNEVRAFPRAHTRVMARKLNELRRREKRRQAGGGAPAPRGWVHRRVRSLGCNDVGRRRRWWRWVPTSVSIPRCQARKPTPTFPPASSTPERAAAVPAEPALSFSLSAHPVGPTTHHLRPLSYPPRLPPIYDPSVPPLELLSAGSPCSSHPTPAPELRLEQLSGYELTELRSSCGGQASELCGLPTTELSPRCDALYRGGAKESVDDGRGIDTALGFELLELLPLAVPPAF